MYTTKNGEFKLQYFLKILITLLFVGFVHSQRKLQQSLPITGVSQKTVDIQQPHESINHKNINQVINQEKPQEQPRSQPINDKRLDQINLMSGQKIVKKEDLVDIKIDETALLNEGVIELNEVNFNQFLTHNNYTVVYFHAKDCQYCHEFNLTFGSMSQISHQQKNKARKISFASLQLNDKTQKIFRQLNIDAVPQLKYFHDARAAQYTHHFNQYGLSSVGHHLEWIDRISRVSEFDEKIQQSHRWNIFGKTSNIRQSLYMKEIQNLQEITKHMVQKAASQLIQQSATHSKQLSSLNGRQIFLMNCSYQEKQSYNKELGQFIKQTYLTHLDHEFYCTQNYTILASPALPASELLFHVYEFSSSKIVQFLQLVHLSKNVDYRFRQEGVSQQNQRNEYMNLNQVYSENLKRYFTSKVEYWSDQSIMQVFTHNQPAFVLIINNETRSRSLFHHYNQIKVLLQENSELPPVKFYYSDLSFAPQSTTKIKKYLSGLESSIGKNYPYPLLGYMKPTEDRVKKFLFPIDKLLTPPEMTKWVVDILKSVEIHEKKEKDADQHLTDSRLLAVETLNNSDVKQFYRTTPQTLFTFNYLSEFQTIYQNPNYTVQQKHQKLKIPEVTTQHHLDLKLINYHDFKILLTELNKKEFFVYVNWKNDMKSYEVLDDISKWWGELGKKQQEEQIEEIEENEEIESPQIEHSSKDHYLKNSPNKEKVQVTQHIETTHNIKIAPPMSTTLNHVVAKDQARRLSQIDSSNLPLPKQQQISKQHQILHSQTKETPDPSVHQHALFKSLLSSTNIYILNYNNNDYPPSYTDSQGKTHDLRITYVPSLIYFSQNRSVMRKVEGVESLQQIKKFIRECYLDQAKVAVHQDKSDQSEMQQHDRLDNPVDLQLARTNSVEEYDRQLEGLAHQHILKKF